jgi:hypothetical protein
MAPGALEMPFRRQHFVLLGLVLTLLLSGAGGAHARAEPGEPATITDYVDPDQAIRFGTRSHWAQPWRSYLDTVPGDTVLDSVGINFNVPPRWADATARLLAESGFKRARVEVGWGTLDYDDPTRMVAFDRKNLVTRIEALRDHGLRPLIVLNANHGRPCPVKLDSVDLVEPASAGDRHIFVDPLDRDRIELRRTGITSEGRAANHLFTEVRADGRVTLSQPLTEDLPAGPLEITTLRYEPFPPSFLPEGTANPAFEPTFEGWINYVDVITHEVELILGSDDFDVEIWNERSFGSGFLNRNSYYEPDVEWRAFASEKSILWRTVAWLRDPLNGVAGVGIGDGFANQTPWPAGSTSPPGLTAIDKHPYAGWMSFPTEAAVNGNRPLNALGQEDGWKDSSGQWHESFTPNYEAFFPEYFLTAIQTETLVRDLSPATTFFGDAAHGRATHPPGGSPPEMWVTEVNLGPGSGPTPRAAMTAADIRHIATKNILRYLSAFTNKGVSAIHFYAANAGDLSLIDRPFFDALHEDFRSYPGTAMGGETMDAVRRFTEVMADDQPFTASRELTLRALTDFTGNTQFEGNGTPQYPSLYNRDVFGFFPVQTSDKRFVIPFYVMTRNVATDYGISSGPERFDLPPELYRLRIGGVRGETAVVSSIDPASGATNPVTIVARSSDELLIETSATDAPRLLVIEEGSAPVPPEIEAQFVGLGGLLRGRPVGLRVSCTERCTVRARAHVRTAGRQFRLETASEALVEPDKPAVIAIKGAKRASRAVQRAHVHRQRVSIVATIHASNSGGSAEPLRLRMALPR